APPDGLRRAEHPQDPRADGRSEAPDHRRASSGGRARMRDFGRRREPARASAGRALVRARLRAASGLAREAGARVPMKQIVQSPKSGKLELVEVPAPAPGPGLVLVRNHFSVMSPGTEKMAIDFARKSLLGKARGRPDLVRQVLRKVRQEGPLPTWRAVMNRLDVAQPLGYSSAGSVERVGEGVVGFAPGDRVACAGAGYANHAEYVAVPENLVARVPEGLALEKAAFATLGAIALQGLRVAAPTLGEVAAVIGLGLIGQLAVQLLRANGCRVLG